MAVRSEPGFTVNTSRVTIGRLRAYYARVSLDEPDVVQTGSDRDGIEVDIQRRLVPPCSSDHRHSIADRRVVTNTDMDRRSFSLAWSVGDGDFTVPLPVLQKKVATIS